MSEADFSPPRLARPTRLNGTARLLLAAAAGFVLLVSAPWLQGALWMTDTPGQDGRTGLWRLAVQAVVAAGAILAAARLSRSAGLDRTIAWIGGHARLLTVLTIAAAFLAPLAAAWFVLGAFPNSGDEYAYLFQARQFAQGRLWDGVPPLGDAFTAYRTWVIDGKLVGQYPPGWSLALAAGMAAGIPEWAVNAVVGAGSIAALAALCRRVADLPASIAATLLFAASPFYVMNAASYFSHTFCSLLILLLCLCLLPARDRPAPLVAAGALIGLLGAARYFSVFPLIPALLFWLSRRPRSALPRAGGCMALGFIPVLLLVMVYQDLITGSPLHSTYFVATDPDSAISFAPGALWYGLKLIVPRMTELALWTTPLLPAAYAVCLALKLKDRTLAFYDLVFPGFVLAFVLFDDLGGNRYGQRYWLDGFPPALATMASALPSVTARLRRWTDRPLLPIGALACLLSMLGIWPLVAAAFHREVFIRQEPYRLAAAAHLHDAIVILETEGASGMMASDLARNPSRLDAPVLYVRATVSLDALRDAFPQRSIWRYRHSPGAGAGELVRGI